MNTKQSFSKDGCELWKKLILALVALFWILSSPFPAQSIQRDQQLMMALHREGFVFYNDKKDIYEFNVEGLHRLLQYRRGPYRVLVQTKEQRYWRELYFDYTYLIEGKEDIYPLISVSVSMSSYSNNVRSASCVYYDENGVSQQVLLYHYEYKKEMTQPEALR